MIFFLFFFLFLFSADSTNTRSGAGVSSSGASLNVGFGWGTSDEKGLEVGRADGSETRGSGSAGGETIVFGSDTGSSGIPTRLTPQNFRLIQLINWLKYFYFNVT